MKIRNIEQLEADRDHINRLIEKRIKQQDIASSILYSVLKGSVLDLNNDPLYRFLAGTGRIYPFATNGLNGCTNTISITVSSSEKAFDKKYRDDQIALFDLVQAKADSVTKGIRRSASDKLYRIIADKTDYIIAGSIGYTYLDGTELIISGLDGYTNYLSAIKDGKLEEGQYNVIYNDAYKNDEMHIVGEQFAGICISHALGVTPPKPTKNGDGFTLTAGIAINAK